MGQSTQAYIRQGNADMLYMSGNCLQHTYPKYSVERGFFPDHAVPQLQEQQGNTDQAREGDKRPRRVYGTKSREERRCIQERWPKVNLFPARMHQSVPNKPKTASRYSVLS